jgi:hypothetical protein
MSGTLRVRAEDTPLMYMIALVIQGQPVEYEALNNAIKALGPWSNRLGNAWMVHSKLSAKRIRDLLKPHIKVSDRLFVAQIGRNWAGTGMGQNFPDWINRRAFELSEIDGQVKLGEGA